MASMSVSNSNSLGNTSLRGFGGLASGIDRDAIIEQMSLGAQTKIENHKASMTKLEWKRDAYRSITDQTLDLQDKYFSYSSSKNLKDPSLFGKTKITTNGPESSTRFVTASGSSDLVDTISIAGVKSLATSSIQKSAVHSTSTVSAKLDFDGKSYESRLKGSFLEFYSKNNEGTTTLCKFEFKDGYVDVDTKEHVDIHYTPDEGETDEEFVLRLKGQLEGLAKANEWDKYICFDIDDKKNITVNFKNEGQGSGPYYIKGTAVSALGLKIEDNKVYTGTRYTASEPLMESSLDAKKNTDIVAGKKLIFEYNGVQKYVELISKEDMDAITGATDKELAIKEAGKHLQSRINKAFGTGNIEVKFGVDGSFSFTPKLPDSESTDSESTLSILSNDDTLLKTLGLDFGESNKVNVSGKLDQAAFGDTFKNLADNRDYTDDKGNLLLTINGEKISGLTKDSTVADILNKINSSKAGVKATYIDSEGTFMLISSETGSGRKIDLKESKLAEKLFGSSNPVDFVDGKDAEISVSYGNGVIVPVKRSSNTFELEGLTITVNGEFGYVKDADGNSTDKIDTSQQVTFTAKADVDKAVETVKSFFEDFNKLVSEVRTQITTRPDSSYGPLTSAQKDEMDETSIENWEKKAKAGILFGDDVMRDYSGALEGIMASFLRATKLDYEDLKEMGITYSEDYLDGGTLVFDESKFRTAMETDSDKVARFMAGGKNGNGGLAAAVESALTPYATRYASKNGNSYGRLVEVAGTEKKPTTLMSNQIYKQLKEMQETLDTLNARLKTEQDRYIKQFSTMENLINTMNTQSSYISQITA